MVLLVLDRRSDATPEIPDGVTVKICSHPSQLIGKAKHETFYASRGAANVAASKLMPKAEGLANRKVGNYLYYVELDIEGLKTAARITIISEDGTILPVIAEVRRGKFFAGREESQIITYGMTSNNEQTFEQFLEVMEIARFICYELV